MINYLISLLQFFGLSLLVYGGKFGLKNIWIKIALFFEVSYRSLNFNSFHVLENFMVGILFSVYTLFLLEKVAGQL